MAKKVVIDATKHVLVPKHTLLSDKEKNTLFEKYNITVLELPKILITDAAIRDLGAKVGDVVKVSKDSPTAGKTVYYRGVINE